VLFACNEFAPLFFPARSVAIVYDLIPQRWGPWAARRRLGWLRDRFQGMRMTSASRLIAISEHTRRDAMATWGVDPSRIVAIPHLLGPEPEVPSPAPARVREVAGGGAYVLYLGARDVRKGLKPLVEAWMARPSSGVRLVVAGGGRSYDQELEVALAEAQAAGRVAIVEDLEEGEKNALLAAAACLVMPSAYEGYGLPVAEAMRVGTPAVTFDNSSLPEAAGDGGVVVPDGDYEGMLARAEAMAADPTVRAAASARARAWIRSLDQQSIGRRFLDVMREAGAR
jgi:glycosyltransferase involved in cell wall biosynthesis